MGEGAGPRHRIVAGYRTIAGLLAAVTVAGCVTSGSATDTTGGASAVTSAPATTAHATSTTSAAATTPPTAAPPAASSASATTTPPSTATQGEQGRGDGRTKDDVRREVLAHINRMTSAFDQCLEQPDSCDARATIGPYASLESAVGRTLVYSIETLQQQGTYARDGYAAIREVESVKVADDLNRATVVACEINPTVVVKDVNNETQVVNDDVGRYRNSYRLLRLANGGWIIGPSERVGDLSADDIPKCESVFDRGKAAPFLADSPTPPAAPTPPATDAELKRAEQQVTKRLAAMRSELDACIESPPTCDVEKIVNRYSLPDTLITDWYPAVVKSAVERNSFYKDASQIKRNIAEITIDKSALNADVIECHYDNATIARTENDRTVEVDRVEQNLVFIYRWVRLQDRGWMILSTAQVPIDDQEGGDAPCSK